MVGRWPKLAGRFLVVNGGRQGRQAGSVIVDDCTINVVGGWDLGLRYSYVIYPVDRAPD